MLSVHLLIFYTETEKTNELEVIKWDEMKNRNKRLVAHQTFVRMQTTSTTTNDAQMQTHKIVPQSLIIMYLRARHTLEQQTNARIAQSKMNMKSKSS